MSFETTREESDAKRGQDDLFLRLFIANQKNIYAYILAMVRNRDAADDIMQESLTIMWRKFDQFDPGTSMAAWGIAIARNLVLRYYRTQSNNSLQFRPDIVELLDKKAARRQNNLTDKVDVLSECLDKLPSHDRHLIQLRYEQNLKIKEIARVVRRPLHGLYKAMARIHDALLWCVARGMAKRIRE